MISPIAKFALAMAETLDDLCDIEEANVIDPGLQQDVIDLRLKLAAAVTEFKATGGAE